MVNVRPVLLVENDTDLREALAFLISERGYVVATAGDGRDALAELEEIGVPSMILLNLRMPRMDGAAFFAELAKRPELSAVPLVVISGSDKVAAEAERLKAVAYLRKPIDYDGLYSILAQYAT